MNTLTDYRHLARRRVAVIVALAVALGVAAALALACGGATLSWPDWLAVLTHGFGAASGPAARIVFEVRLPRVLAAALAGAILGLTGLASQTLFRNPLASPHVTGVTSGAAAGAVAGMLLGPASWGVLVVPLFGVAGGLLVATVVYLIGRSGASLGPTVLLAGIALGAFASSLTSGALYLAGERLQTVVFWLMGGFWRVGWREVGVFAGLAAACLVVLGLAAPAMNVLLTGERSAGDLGVEVRRCQQLLLGVVAVGTAGVVGHVGTIGFVGLVVPHLLRLAMGGDHRHLVPACALGGALLLLLADTLARTLAVPAEIPVGVLTSLVGAPVFLWMLLRQRRGGLAG